MSKLLILVFLFTINWKLSHSIGLNCTFSFHSYPFLDNVYRCNAEVLIEMEREKITVVNGTHSSGYTNTNVQGLDIFDGRMEYFPVNIAEFFPNIRALYFPYNSITYVNNQHLIPFPNLVYLYLGHNRITTLNSNLFTGLRSMRWISFYDNYINHVGVDFILPNIAEIDFESNTCINVYATTPDAIRALGLKLQENCPPTWLININSQIQSLINRAASLERDHSEIDSKLQNVTNTVEALENRSLQLTNDITGLNRSNLELTNEMSVLQQSNLQLTSEVTNLQRSNVELTNEVEGLSNEVTDLQQSNVELTDQVTDLQQNNLQLTNQLTDLQQSNVELTNEVTELTNEVTQLQESNGELTNRNSDLERRIEFLDTRAGYVEVRLAVLESIIESKLGNHK